jgi:hypothetical protein
MVVDLSDFKICQLIAIQKDILARLHEADDKDFALAEVARVDRELERRYMQN